MAEGLINVDNAAEQERLAREQLNREFTPHVMAARDEAEGMSGLGRRLKGEYEELLKVVARLSELNKLTAEEVGTAHKTMTGGRDTTDYGVAHHAQDVIQGPKGGQIQNGRARRALRATQQLALLVPEPAEWRGAHQASEDVRQRINALGGLVTSLIASTEKVPQERFDGLKGKATHASGELQTHMNKL